MRFTSITLFLVFYTLFNQAYAQWYWEHPVPQGNHLTDFSFRKNSSLGFAVGDYGVIITTENNGASWKVMDSVTTTNLSSVFVTENHAYIVGDNGLMLKTDDDSTWYQTESFTHYKLYSVHFTDDDHGYAVGYQGTILKTNGGGEFWQYIMSGTPFTLYSVYFATENLGFTVGDSGTILRSMDAGLNWSPVGTWTEPLFDVHFPSDTTGYISGKGGLILRTQDAGLTWTDVSSPVIKQDLYSIHFYNDTIGYAAGAEGIIIHTNNGGGLWVLDTTWTSNTFRSVHQFYSDTACDTVIACGEFGIIQKKNTCGNFNDITGGSYETFGSILFLPDSSGIAIGGYPFTDEASIYRTPKPGGPWSEIAFDSLPHYPTDISFPTDSLGYISARKGKIYKSIDAGNTWVPVRTDVISDLYTVCFPDSVQGFAAGVDGLMIKTTNIDTMWTPLLTGVTDNFYALHFFDKFNGYAAGENGALVRIRNNGQNITKINTETTASLYDIFFPTDSIGFMCGYDGKIFRINRYLLSDSIFPINSGVTVPLNKIWFPNPDTGYIAGEVGTILKTTDGGNTWYPQYTGTTNSFRGVFFFNGLKGYVAGAGLTIMSTDNGGGPVIIPSFTSENPIEDGILMYPNPAEEFVNIEFKTNRHSRVQVRIFDLAGKEIIALPTGSSFVTDHKFRIDTADLNPGIYLVMILADEKVFAKKLVLSR